MSGFVDRLVTLCNLIEDDLPERYNRQDPGKPLGPSLMGLDLCRKAESLSDLQELLVQRRKVDQVKWEVGVKEWLDHHLVTTQIAVVHEIMGVVVQYSDDRWLNFVGDWRRS